MSISEFRELTIDELELKILEAGGGTKVEDPKTSNLVEAGGGRKITAGEAKEKFDEEKKIFEEE